MDERTQRRLDFIKIVGIIGISGWELFEVENCFINLKIEKFGFQLGEM